MLTTQVQVLLYVGNIQIVSCSVFIPVPAIVVKSHQTLEAILPYLPLALTSSSADTAVVAPVPAIEPPIDPLCPTLSSSSSLLPASSTSLILSPSTPLSSASTSTPVPSCSSPTCTSPACSHKHRHSSSTLSHSHSQAHSSALTISPDSSIPATTCIKISLRPTPSFKLVNPKCPHQQQRNRNLRHLKQQQQQQELYLQQQQEQELQEQRQRQRRPRSPPPPQLSSPPSAHRSHSQSHSHSHSRSQSPSTQPRSHHSSHRSSHRRHSHRCTHSSMTSLSTRPQTSVLFTYPYVAASTSSPKVVQVTGSFNDWQRTEPLILNPAQARFELEVTVSLKDGSEEKQKILFKFVLDGQEWVTDASQEQERDYAGNLNNVLVLDPIKATVTQNNTSNEESTTEKTETEEERLARLKQEEEDDATIRQLGGGMWGAPSFAVNDPVNLPEHFVNSAAPVAAEEAEEREQEDKHEDEEKGLPSTPAQQPVVVQKTEPIAAVVEQPTVTTSSPAVATVVLTPADKEEEVEDEDDETIRRLGGGMWGTPFFKVNDPAALPEHFVEALGATSITANPATSTSASDEVIVDREEEELSEGEVLRDDLSGTMEGTLIETVVDTTEDIVIEDAQGNFLEESITTSRQELIQGEVEEKVTEVIETIEDIEPADPIVSTPPTPTPSSTAVVEGPESTTLVEESTESAQNVTMTETEVLSVGANGEETTVLEETITFVEGPEVDSTSLHSLTTAIKPVQEGENVLVEAAPEVHVQTPPVQPAESNPSVASAGDAKPSVDVSTIAITANSAISTSNHSPSSTARTSLHGDHHDGDGDYGVVYLQGQRPVPSGDATPAADLSVDVTAQEVPTLKPSVPSKTTTATGPVVSTTPAEKTEKSEKRKSFWKKLKKVLT
ncbi:hypothetical protein EMPS_00171 [Entomortierella parvispora]|uniref:AMP-activated protein kinase glycogen-binding domain-containing protein n=1 Tax=Entomortierella parvispora TaxID=205924 RepID=A0A9P3LRQ6_9FUNG|nr:hypothetical protein EMPS_00171 [Entomortierella parvispora]